jgi:ABC-type transporter Mla maintaining outer membrane lipid asymmetry permease subunit MlaE
MIPLVNRFEGSSAPDAARFLTALGRSVRRRLGVFVDLATLLYLAFRELIAERQHGFSLVFEITLRQIYFTGVQALRVITLVSLTLGTIVIVQMGTKLSFIGGGVEFIVPVLILVICRELGPLHLPWYCPSLAPATHHPLLLSFHWLCTQSMLYRLPLKILKQE